MIFPVSPHVLSTSALLLSRSTIARVSRMCLAVNNHNNRVFSNVYCSQHWYWQVQQQHFFQYVLSIITTTGFSWQHGLCVVIKHNNIIEEHNSVLHKHNNRVFLKQYYVLLQQQNFCLVMYIIYKHSTIIEKHNRVIKTA